MFFFNQFKKKQSDLKSNNSISDPLKVINSNRLVFTSLTNPVLVYVKILMTLFLILIHLKSKIFNQKLDDSNGNHNHRYLHLYEF